MGKLRCFSVLNVVLLVLILSNWGNGEVESVAAPMEQKEQQALYFAIQGFTGNWWNGSDLYPDPCGWTPIQGVSCDLFDGFWYVTGLSIGPIHENSLACDSGAKFSTHLFSLKHLKSLSFFNCFLSSNHHPIAIPADDWKILAGSLESLEFRGNPGLIGHIPTTFGDLQKLQSLVVVENGLAGEIPSSIGYLTNLERLVLSGNGLRGRIPDSFGGLSKLLIFDVSRNNLSGPLPITFGGLISLLKLDLSNNQIDGKIPEEIGNLKSLTLLDLSFNRFSQGLPKSLQEMSSVEELVLSQNPIGGDLSSLEWQNLSGLLILDLSNNNLIGGIPESLAELKRLRFLGLNDNNLSGDISPKLEALPNLSSIYLHGNNLTGELKFSPWFYGKLGRHFGAWDNPYLCYPMELMSSNHVPFGVKPCQHQGTLYENGFDTKSHLGNGNLKHNSYSLVSMGFSRFSNYGLWMFLIQQFMVALALNICI